MSRTVMCPHCGVLVQSKFTTDPNKRPRNVCELRYCHVCGVMLRLISGVYGMVKGAEVVSNG